MNDTLARMAYLSDISSHSSKVGRLLHDASDDCDLADTVDRLYKEMDIRADDKVDTYLHEIERMNVEGISIVHFFSSDYPVRLRDIEDSPIILYLKGGCRDYGDCIAISGSRNPSSRGHKAARNMATDLSKMGYTIVAGLARGIDLEAHLGVLETDGRTFAVLPGSISELYPKEHTRLAEEIIEKGLLISEMSSIERMNRLSFIRRNRITTGISSCLVIGESDGTGGTLQQFKIAKKQDRPIFAIRPDDKDHHAMKGFSRFTGDGAIPVEDAEDVVEKFNKMTKGQATLGDF